MTLSLSLSLSHDKLGRVSGWKEGEEHLGSSFKTLCTGVLVVLGTPSSLLPPPDPAPPLSGR